MTMITKQCRAGATFTKNIADGGILEYWSSKGAHGLLTYVSYICYGDQPGAAFDCPSVMMIILMWLCPNALNNALNPPDTLIREMIIWWIISFFSASLSELPAAEIWLFHRECLGCRRLRCCTYHSGEQARVAVTLETYLNLAGMLSSIPFLNWRRSPVW